MSETGPPKSGVILGEVAKPPFAVLPDPSSLFLNRSKRLAVLAPGHELYPYLQFLAELTRAQHDIQADLPAAVLPPFERIGQALDHGMPPVSHAVFEVDVVVDQTITRLVARLARAELPPPTVAAVQALLAASPDDRRALSAAVLKDDASTGDLVQRTLVAAGLQVHFARLAALFVADDLKLVANSACPTCGSGPATSSVVGWPQAHNTRFCTCWLCGTMWNLVRAMCVLCGSTDGISFRSIEGRPDTVKAETCDKCRSYLKVLYQVRDVGLEPLADDVATLALDMLLAGEGWKRGGQNPFLHGY